MKTLCRLALVVVLVFLALGSSTAVKAMEEAEPPGPGCVWAYGGNGGVYSCSWGCDYTYEYANGNWVLVGVNCAS